MDEDEIIGIAGWKFSDGTLVSLLDINDNPELVCFNAPALIK